MPPSKFRFSGRALLFSGVALTAMISAAAAADLPATPEGAKQITDFIATFAGKAATASPGFSVTPEGSDYLLALDLGAVTAGLKEGGVTYDSVVLKAKVVQQDDGAWRIEQMGLPPISGHAKQHKRDGGETIDFTLAMTGHKSVVVVDPAISWLRSGSASDEKGTVQLKGPGLQETIGLGAIQADLTTTPSSGGVVASALKETLSSFSLDVNVDPKAANPDGSPDAKPVHFTADSTAATVDIHLDGVKPAPLIDVWKYYAAHPSRAELAANAPAFKSLLTAAIAMQASLAEKIGMEKLKVQASVGTFEFEGLRVELGGHAAGPASDFSEHFAASKIVIPPEIAPEKYRDLIPTSFDFGFKVSGFDLAAAGAEWISDLKFDGDGPPISKDDGDKIFAKLIGSNAVVLEIPRSHIQAPKLDVSLEGKVIYAKGRPHGSINVHVRDFDKSVASLKQLGPEIEKEMVPVLAMAKGLAKTEADGVLSWVAEVGEDNVIKVNGLPLGKSPF